MNPSREALDDFNGTLENLAASAVADPRSDGERLRSAASAFIEGLDRRMAVDLETCIHCGMCAEACHFYIATDDERFTPAYRVDPLRRFYRRELSPMRFLYRLFTKKLDMDELGKWRELVYDACTACGRCDMMCPMGINISNGINVMRQGLAAAGLAPAALNAQTREQAADGTLYGVGKAAFEAVVNDLRGKGLEIPLDRAEADVFVLTTAIDVRLFPDSIAAVAKIMNHAGADWTMSGNAFDAANAGLISGDKATKLSAVQRIIDHAAACGASTVVVPESGHAYQALRWEAANLTGSELPFDVLSIAEYVSAAIADGRLKLRTNGAPSAVTYHDPCRLGRHSGVFDEPRAVLQALGMTVREMDSNRRENLCCGGGCGEYAITKNRALRQRAFELKRHEVDEAGAEAVVTGCNNCRLNFLNGAAGDGWDKTIVSLTETVAGRIAE